MTIYDIGAAVLNDPFFQVAFSVVTNAGAYDADGLWVETPVQTSVTGHIQPLRDGSNELQNLPEGILAKDCIKVYTQEPITIGLDNVSRYEIVYKSKTYTVCGVYDYRDEYGYVKTIAYLKTHIHTNTLLPLNTTLPAINPSSTEVAVDSSGTFASYRIRMAYATIVADVAVFNYPPKAITSIATIFQLDMQTIVTEVSISINPDGSVSVPAGYNGLLLKISYEY